MTPEARARQDIDAALAHAGWIVQDRADANLYAGLGVAIRELPTPTGPADYILFLDRRAVAVLEAKPAGVTLGGAATQGAGYAAAAPAGYPCWADPLPFLYLSSGAETLFRDAGDPRPAPRPVFAVHRPETLRRRLQAPGTSLRARLAALPPLDPAGLRACQAEALHGVEASLRQARPRALVHMATGAGKTYTACALSHRLLSGAGARRILFLVDRANLGSQTKDEFDGFKPRGAAGLFRDDYNIQHLRGRTLDPEAHVVISTIQRLYACLRNEDLDPEAEDRSSFEDAATQDRPVSYNPAIPPEAFDLVIVDECHRSIYGAWRQVLDYFDAFTIGLTATPGAHTRGFFNSNVVSQYPFDRSVADGVNVGFEIFRIRTEVGERGGRVQAGHAVPRRNRATRARRWETLAEDLAYTPAQLNRAVEVPNQIRTVLQTFRDALPTQLFPGRREIPKTLIFCLNESHAETTTALAREVLDLDDTGAQKITHRSGDGQALIRAFRTSHRFRVAVTVDMVATGTDIKPLECLIFLRDVRSDQYYRQMLGRGARTLRADDLRLATPSAAAKDRFVVIDAVGVTESHKEQSEPLDREPSATLKHLLERAAVGHADEDLCATLAARLARLARRLDTPSLARIATAAPGADLHTLARALVDSADPAAIDAEAARTGAPPEAAAATLREAALRPLASNAPLRRALLEEQSRAEVVVDELTPDRVLAEALDPAATARTTDSFRQFIEDNADTVAALSFLYNRPHAARRLTYAALQDLAAAMAQPPWLLDSAGVWAAYRRLHGPARVRDPARLVTDLVALVRFALGHSPTLEPLAPEVARRFELWLGREKKAGREYTPDQQAWLRLLRDAVAANAEVTPADLRNAPAFANEGGLARARRLFGPTRLPALLDELGEALMPRPDAA